MRLRLPLLAMLGVAAASLAGCENGFGKPCSLPKSQAFREACSGGAPAVDAGDQEIEMSSAASCAVRNYAACETRICLLYRGSSPFCSEECTADGDCPDNAVCRPILGDSVASCADPNDPFSQCYCVKKSLLDGPPADETPAAPTPDAMIPAPPPM